MLRRVCAYCRAEIGPRPEQASLAEGDLVSHGICRHCLEKTVAGSGVPFHEFLETLGAPVFVVDREGRIAGANAYARSLVATRSFEIEGRLGGEVLGCTHAKEPGGCGHTIHCESCSIRLRVMETLCTGEPAIGREACQYLDTFEGTRQVRFRISTEKAGESVLLRIDDAQIVEEEAS